MNGYGNGTLGKLIFNGSIDQQIKGTFSTNFHKLTLDKTSGNLNIADNLNVSINDSLKFLKDGLFQIGNTNQLLFTANANTPVSSGGNFSNTRMIKYVGTEPITGLVRKTFTPSTAGTFIFPIGINNDYNNVEITIPSSAGNPYFEITLHSPEHPELLPLPTDYLKKYWQVNSNNLNTISTAKFYYNQSEVIGDETKFIPSLYTPSYHNGGGDWQLNLGTNPNVNTSVEPSYINLTNTNTLNGDVTAGSPYAFDNGIIYYSRATGDWNVPSNWSYQNHTGSPSSYYPGQIYNEDVVFIDQNHIIDFRYNPAAHLTPLTASSMTIGATQTESPGHGGTGTGRLNFGVGAANLHLVLTNTANTASLYTANNGRISHSAGARLDTLSIFGSIINTSSAANGIQLYNSPTAFTTLNIPGTYSSTISGEGNWGTLGKIILNKDNGSDILAVESTTLCKIGRASCRERV